MGVLLYSIMEGRLPFDPMPGSRRQSPTSHRIARCEWVWCRYGDKHGEWEEGKPERRDLEGGREIVEALLKRARSRWSLERVQQTEWVKEGIKVEGGLKVECQDD
jgi:protein-serine/threonine kinase